MIIAFKVKVEIPDLLMEEIRSINFKSKKSIRYAIKLAAILIYALEEDEDLDSDEFYKPMSSSYIRDKLTTHPFYIKYFVAQLQENMKEGKIEDKIFQTDGRYSPGFYALHYRINPRLLVGPSKEYEVEIELECLNDLFPEVLNHFNNSVRLIKPLMSKHEMAEKIQQQSHQMCLTSINGFSAVYWPNYEKDPTNGADVYKLKAKVNLNGSKTVYTPIEVIEKEINLLNSVSNNPDHILIVEINKKNKTNYRVTQIDEFFERKKKRFTSLVNKKVDNVIAGNWHPIISSTNGRLNHGFTSINKFCIDFFSLDGEVIESYDLKSSQPTILANLLIYNTNLLNSLLDSKFEKLILFLKKNRDVFFNIDEGEWFQEFIDGDIYSSISKELGYSSRAKAKKEMMVLFFTEPGYPSPLITPIRKLFPKYLNGLLESKKSFKENHKSCKKTFPVFLQLVEAHIFIEIIYPALAEAGIPALTKHDSILFPKSRYKEVEKIVANCFKKIGFRGKMELEKTESKINIWPDWYKPAQNEDELY